MANDSSSEPRQDQPVDPASLCTCGHRFDWHWNWNGGYEGAVGRQCEHGDKKTGKRCTCEKFVPAEREAKGCSNCDYTGVRPMTRGTGGLPCEFCTSPEPLQDGGERPTDYDGAVALWRPSPQHPWREWESDKSDEVRGEMLDFVPLAVAQRLVAEHPHQDSEQDGGGEREAMEDAVIAAQENDLSVQRCDFEKGWTARGEFDSQHPHQDVEPLRRDADALTAMAGEVR